MATKELFFQFKSNFVHCRLDIEPEYFDEVYVEKLGQSVDPSNLPTITFQNLDLVLKRQFYQRCFPVIRRKLWLSSKKTSNLGEKPKTYGTTNAVFKEIEECPCKLFDENVVIILLNTKENLYHIVFKDIFNLNLNFLKQIFEFQVYYFCFENSTVSNQQLKSFLPRHVSYLYFGYSNIDCEQIIDHLPNLKRLVITSPQGKLTDVKTLYNFIQHLPRIDFGCKIEEMTVDKKELFKYFKECDYECNKKQHIFFMDYTQFCCKKISDVKREE
uniref:DUF38 domain-containing protein n=1 Tax=Panagrolaimus sp. JU765 TaxID=591449 RepID=A0AC34QPA6_9BILA